MFVCVCKRSIAKYIALMNHGSGIWYLHSLSYTRRCVFGFKMFRFCSLKNGPHWDLLVYEKLIFLFVYGIVIGYIWYKIVIITVYNLKPTF